ncbi:succinylornithine transaminase [Salmonella enterica subsp. enterica]|nr:succinylornithine transaminase [Salmonella enterica subsp. enterica]
MCVLACSVKFAGWGLLLGCVLQTEFAGKAKLIAQEAAKAGVMVLIAGGDVVRFAPALNVSDEEIATGLGSFCPGVRTPSDGSVPCG